MITKLQPLPHQRKLTESESPITIVNWDRGEGATYGMFLKWLCSMTSALMVDSKDQRFHQCCDFLQDIGLEFTTTIIGNWNCRRITIKDYFSIDFYEANSFLETVRYLKPSNYLWLIDNVDMYFNCKDVNAIIERLDTKKQIVFSCDYNNLGWRHLEYDRGSVVFHSETGDLIARKYSWDRCLINWNHNDLKRRFATKAIEEFYIKEVEFV